MPLRQNAGKICDRIKITLAITYGRKETESGMKYTMATVIWLLMAVCPAQAGKLMTFTEVRECVRLDHEIISTDTDLLKNKAELEEKRELLITLSDKVARLKARADKEKADGNTQEYNRLVDDYNTLVAEHSKKLATYENLSAGYVSAKERLDKKKADFTSACNSRRIFKPDLRKACRESPHSVTPFCTKNLK